jgi:hypothetical protein
MWEGRLVDSEPDSDWPRLTHSYTDQDPDWPRLSRSKWAASSCEGSGVEDERAGWSSCAGWVGEGAGPDCLSRSCGQQVAVEDVSAVQREDSSGVPFRTAFFDLALVTQIGFASHPLRVRYDSEKRSPKTPYELSKLVNQSSGHTERSQVSTLRPRFVSTRVFCKTHYKINCNSLT